MDANAAKIVSADSFNDPNGVYPKNVNESDTNRLARGDNYTGTILQQMAASRAVSVPLAGSGSIKSTTTDMLKTWDMPVLSYAAKYPHNKVLSGSSGHTIEIDDTPNAERLNWFHKSGSYNLIDPSGNIITVSVTNVYTNINNNRRTNIRCNESITIGGEMDVFVQNGANVRIHGDSNNNIGGSYNINILGNANVAVLGDMVSSVGGNASTVVHGNATTEVHGDHNMNITGAFNLKANGVNIESSGGLSMKSAGSWAVDASDYIMENNASVSVNIAAVSAPNDLYGGGLSPYVTTAPQQLHTTIIGMNYDAMKYFDEGNGSSAANIAAQINSGKTDPNILKSAILTKKTSLTVYPRSTTVIQPTYLTMQEAQSLDSYPTKLKISRYATMGTYTHNGIEEIESQLGVSAAEIAYNIGFHATNIFDVIYAMYPSVIVSSGFRNRNNNPFDNMGISDHESGHAADFIFPSKTRYEVAQIAQQLTQKLNYDELLLCSCGDINPCATDQVWIHISTKNGNNRGLVWTYHNGEQYGFQGLEALNYDASTVC